MEIANEEKQFELLFTWDFNEIEKFTGEISDEILNDFFTINLERVILLLKKSNILETHNYKNAGLQDGLWINVLGNGFEFIDQERGNIFERTFFNTYDELLSYYAKILLRKIPKYSKL